MLGAISDPAGDTELGLSRFLFRTFADWLGLRLGPVIPELLAGVVADTQCQGASIETVRFHQHRDQSGCPASACPIAVVVIAAWLIEAASLSPVLAYDPIRMTKLFNTSSRGTNLIDDMRLLVSFVNWHRTLRFVHSVQLDDSEASH